jgi:hypothetical protein
MKPRRENAKEGVLTGRRARPVPYGFVLDALARAQPVTRAMFGCVAVYVGERIVLALREREDHPADNGLWIATTHDHHASLGQEIPGLRSVGLLGKAPTAWQCLPGSHPEFESLALQVCALVLANDPRIGKIPPARRSRARQ